MLRLFPRKPALGLEINSSFIRAAVASADRKGVSVLAANAAALPAGVVSENYTSPNIADPDGFGAALRECLGPVSRLKITRAALSLPDSLFRVQTLDFDALPAKGADRERLIRWRLEKAAAFDMSDVILRHQVLRRRGSGFTLLVCAAKREVIAQYEAMLAGLGLEPWIVGLSSFHVVNFYFSSCAAATPVAAFAHITEGSFAALVMENGGLRFYRYKEMKRGSADDVRSRLIREIGDSLHFYTHLDRSQPSEIGRLYLTGDAPGLDALAEGLRASASLEVEVLSPAAVPTARGGAGPEMAAALGAAWGL